MTAKENKERVAFIGASTPAEGARVMNVDGKWLRNILRGTLHVHVSKGDAYGEDVRAALYDAARERLDKRAAKVESK